MSCVKERIEQLRVRMNERNIDAYLVPTSDYHETEYVGEHFACRKYITGFTGSSGTALIMKDWAGLWTDGRYFVQAATELAGSGVELMKIGQAGVPKLEGFLMEHMSEGQTLGFDGRVINAHMGENLAKRLKAKKINIDHTGSLVGEIWEGRPELPANPVWILSEDYSGKPAADKITQIREAMEASHATVHIITTLDDIIWLLNIRGNDIPCTPVVLSYLAVTKEDITLFINPSVINEEVMDYLNSLGVMVREYQDVYTYTQELRDEMVLLEKEKVNYAIVQDLDASNKILNQMNPTALDKSKKNETEINNFKTAHIKDGVAVTKFIYWLKHNIGKIPMTEVSVSDYMEQLRSEQGCLDLSFATISAYGANAAMCHYHANREQCADLEPRGLYLIDSGGQYLEGTTDITRTMALGPVTQAEKEHYTLVLMGMLRIGNVKFLQGCSGLSLDFVAREPLWSRGLDYNHGTGHGIGYLSGVHERPAGIRYRTVPERHDSAPFEVGMVCSDEPGVYIEGSHGIRLENQLFCKEDETTSYGQFLCFEFLTYAPLDLEPIEVALMEDKDIGYLNEYHQKVYEKIAPYLTQEEARWLKKVTQPIER